MAAKPSAPLSMTYDVENKCLVMACTDGTIWKRVMVRHANGTTDTWAWVLFDTFTGVP